MHGIEIGIATRKAALVFVVVIVVVVVNSRRSVRDARRHSN